MGKNYLTQLDISSKLNAFFINPHALHPLTKQYLLKKKWYLLEV